MPKNISPEVAVPARREIFVDEVLNLKQVMAATGLCKTEIYNLMRAEPPEFPLNFPVQVGSSKVGWLATEVLEWRQRQIDDARSKPRRTRPAGPGRGGLKGKRVNEAKAEVEAV